ncbi:peptidyl-prolyl cis-trans isomerase FKBP16-1, chloroplastic-like isoform X2 [Salvia splendens]|uniref:peptidyl-prolyl cis-trans isomerase FKBP16-1, chloroplastic-like isoform X2 n=1 Tax=Salvia splendens TaxID=180675 RepID=UPI001C26B6F7|nr:peptidyl-prolyl cis-trans isomerase FKBP16-1, chloroplastic-like isoform X2 [Salvia splendens]
MAAFEGRLLLPLLSAFSSSSVRATKLVCVQTKLDMEDAYPSIVAVKVARRAILGIVGVNVVLGKFCAARAAPMQDMKEPDVLRTLKLPSGVIIQVEGKGKEADEEDTVQFNYVCRRSNGYFVHSTVSQFSGESSPVILRLGDEQMIKGLKEVLSGMKVGGKRRALIPPSVGYTSEALQPIPEEFGPRRSLLSHAKEPLIFEVQLLKLL